MSDSLSTFYRRKRVLVTGHTDFHGGWLVAWLKLLGAQVCGYGPPPSTRPNFFDATMLDRGITSVFGDLRDRNALATAFAEFQPEIVIHTAHHSRHSAQEPVETFGVNMMGTVHILEEARLTKSVRAIVIVTSDTCYQNVESCREGDALGGNDAYSSSQACAELAASAYMGTFFKDGTTSVATVRAADPIGGGDWSEGSLISAIVLGIASGNEVVIHDESHASTFQHVLETTRACLVLGQHLYESGSAYVGPWNFAPPHEDTISTQELAENFIRLWGAGKPTLQRKRNASSTPHALRLNTEKARNHLNWTTALRLSDAIAWTVEWYRAFYKDPASARRVTEDQIKKYMKLAGK